MNKLRLVAAGVEKKFFDGEKTIVTVAGDAGTLLNESLNLIQEGTTPSERIGRKCTITNILIRGQVLVTGTTTAANMHDTVRILVVLDRQTNGAALTNVDDILTNGSSLHGTFMFNDLTVVRRFKILWDKTITMNQSGAGLNATDTWPTLHRDFHYYKKVKIPLYFDLAAATIANIESNNIVVLAVSTHGLASIRYNWRLRFVG